MPMQTLNALAAGPRREAPVERWKEFKSQQEFPLQDYLECAKQLIDTGAPLLAYDVTKMGLRKYPDSVELMQKMGLALARSQVTVEAYQLARKLYEELGLEDEESIGLLARTLKDLWEQCRDPRRKAEYLRLSAAYYEKAYYLEIGRAGGQNDKGYWTGINAATLAVVRDDPNMAKRLAEQVLQQCMALEQRGGPLEDKSYWLLATLGEACLILGIISSPTDDGKVSEAIAWYQKAAEIAYDKREFGSLGATLRNARLLMENSHLSEEDKKKILDCFRLPRVVIFAGHMIDAPNRKRPRFPADLKDAVRNAIDAQLDEYGPIIGYSSAASGADILFLEAVKARNCDSFVFLPYEKRSFAKDSVEPAGGEWVTRFEGVLQNAFEVVTVAPHQRISWGSVTYDYCNLILDGLATVHSQHLDCEIKRLCVWDEEPGDGPGGTAAIVNRWKKRGKDVDIINPRKLNSALAQTSNLPPSNRLPDAVLIYDPLATTRVGNDILDRLAVKALLFADVKNYSGLTEEQMPGFIEHFYGLVSRLMHRSSHPPVTTEDRGDGVYCVFDTAWEAAHFALDFNDCMKRMKWKKLIGRDLQLRIGLHAGPIHEFVNPITGRLAYTGTHVSRAARIEPVAPPGEVYASREFAALAAVEDSDKTDRQFSCVYVGLTPWHKDYGVEPTFQVRRRFH